MVSFSLNHTAVPNRIIKEISAYYLYKPCFMISYKQNGHLLVHGHLLVLLPTYNFILVKGAIRFLYCS